MPGSQLEPIKLECLERSSLVAQTAKNQPANSGDLGSISGLGRSPGGGGQGNPLQYSCLENPYGQRSLAGYSPWGYKESDTTERLSTAQHEDVLYNMRNTANIL